MAAYAWAKSRSILLRLWSGRVRRIDLETVGLDRPDECTENQSKANERYFMALKNGGIWLS